MRPSGASFARGCFRSAPPPGTDQLGSLRHQVALTQYVLKTGWEIVMTPVTYRIVGALKKAEDEDYYDKDTDFTPFSLQT